MVRENSQLKKFNLNITFFCMRNNREEVANNLVIGKNSRKLTSLLFLYILK